MSSVYQQRRMVLRLLVISLAVFLASLWGWMQRREGAAPAAAEGPIAERPCGGEREDGRPDDAGAENRSSRGHSEEPRSYRPGASTAIPRPATTRTAPPEEAGDSPLDRRADPGPDRSMTPEAIREIVEAIKPDIEDCLIQWWMLDPALEGEVMMRFSLGPEGLEHVSIEEHSGVPAGPLSCFGAAIYDGDWPSVTGHLDITYPFTFFSEAEE